MRGRFLLLALFLLPAGRASAEWQLKPWLGTTFAASTTFFDLDQGASVHHIAVGVTGVKLGEIFGIEADVAHVPRFFQSGGPYSQAAALDGVHAPPVLRGWGWRHECADGLRPSRHLIGVEQPSRVGHGRGRHRFLVGSVRGQLGRPAVSQRRRTRPGPEYRPRAALFLAREYGLGDSLLMY